MQTGLKYPDIGFTPEYQDLFADTAFGGEPCHFEAAGIDYRFYKRPIPGTDHCDITSVYGYGGIVALSEDAKPISFYDQFHLWCREYGVVSEFVRIHPFYQFHNAMMILHFATGNNCYQRSGEIAYIDLTQTEDEIWKGFDKGCRSAIKKAEKMSPVSVGPMIGDSFPVWYHRTMDRLNASDAYYFTSRFWGILKSMETYHIKTLTAAALFFFHGDFATYFLSASDKSQPGAMNLILWTAIKEAKRRGCRIFNLGGGLHDGDSLSSFKRSFTPTTKPFYTYRRIHNPKVYEELCRAKGIEADSVGFFPAYRR